MKTKEEILTQLEHYLPPVLFIELEISMAVPRGLTICCTIDHIIHDYHASQAEEDHVTELLQDLLEYHFSSKTN